MVGGVEVRGYFRTSHLFDGRIALWHLYTCWDKGDDLTAASNKEE